MTIKKKRYGRGKLLTLLPQCCVFHKNYWNPKSSVSVVLVLKTLPPSAWHPQVSVSLTHAHLRDGEVALVPKNLILPKVITTTDSTSQNLCLCSVPRKPPRA